MDIDTKTFSTSIETIKVYTEKVNIVILTHLFGIPNPQRVEIGMLLKDCNIPIIDDLSQTVFARVNGESLESLCENYFYSFAIDKPIGLGIGGMLYSENNFLTLYSSLQRMRESEGSFLVKKAIHFKYLLSPDIYSKNFRYDSFFQDLILRLWPIGFNYKILKFILGHPIMILFFRLTQRRKRRTYSLRLTNNLINLICDSLLNYKNCNVVNLERALRKIDVMAEYLSIPNIECSIGTRAVVICKKHERIRMIEYLINNGIECGNHNWQKLICQNEEEFPNAIFVKERLINIPVYNESIYN